MRQAGHRLSGRPTLQVSRATAGFLDRGHPWVRPDRFTVGLEHLQAGQTVTLVDERGKGLATALADPAAEVCARVFHRMPDKAFDPAAAIGRAWERRAALHGDPATTCYRVVHGEADFLPGLRVERYADVLVVLVLADCIAPHIDALCGALAQRLAGARIVVRDHRADIRREEVRARLWNSTAILDPEESVIGHELGVPVAVRPFAGLATGIYVDQRATRTWLRPQATGKRVLNLFAYTGLFSTCLLEAGGARALDVDLSAPSLGIAGENARLAGVADRHAIAQGECRTVLGKMTDEFDVVIVDPPTSAQGAGTGDKAGWILRRDYPEVLELAWARTAPGGLLVACCNTLHGKPFALAQAVAATCPGGRTVATPGPAEDVPMATGFPEGRPWQLVAVRKTG